MINFIFLALLVFYAVCNTALAAQEPIKSTHQLKTIADTGIEFHHYTPFGYPDLQDENKFDDILGFDENAPDNDVYEAAAKEFHRVLNEQEKSSAINLLQPIAYNPHSSNQARAAYSLLRLANKSGGYKAVWDLSEEYRTNPLTSKIYYKIEDYRFIALTNGRGGYKQKSDLETDLNYLRWLLRIVQNKEKLPGETSSEFQDYRKEKAYYHLNNYLMPATTESNKSPLINGWLTNEKLLSSRMQAVRIEAKNNLLLDWMQTMYAFNPLHVDWLWALYDGQNPVWVQQKQIVAHAMDQYRKNGNSPEWLLPAAQRVVLGDTNLANIVKDGTVLINDPEFRQSEPKLIYLLQYELIRIALLEHRYDDARMLALKRDLPSFNEYSGNYSFLSSYITDATRQNTLRWFLHRGEWDDARQLIKLYEDKHIMPATLSYDDSRYDETRLATSSSAADLVKRLSVSAQSHYAGSPLWNLISTDLMMKLAQNKKTSDKFAWKLGQTAYLRTWLMQDAKKMKQSALITDGLTSTGEKGLLSTIENDRFTQAAYVLTIPRYRPFPIPLHQPSPWDDYYRLDGKENADKIDIANPNDNNWWCQTSLQQLNTQLAQAWEYPPNGYGYSRILRDYHLSYDPTQYSLKKADNIAKHPIWQLSDKNEIRELTAIPKGAEYLSKIVISKASGVSGWWQRWVKTDNSDEVAEALHLAVRATRTSCRRQGSHAEYSRKAYKILHTKFPNSIWTKATPYWFGTINKEYPSSGRVRKALPSRKSIQSLSSEKSPVYLRE